MSLSPSSAADPQDRALAARLLAAGRLPREVLDQCLALQAARGGASRVRLAAILVERGLASREEIQAFVLAPAPPPIAPPPPTRLEQSNETRVSPAVPHAPAAATRSSSGEAPRRIDQYALVRELGRGGMGVVFLAEDTSLKRRVAIKMILDPAFAGPEHVSRFQREASAAARLHHPGIVGIFGVGSHEGKPYLVLEYVEGESLEALLRRGIPPPRRIAELVRGIALALEHAHANGVVHRDVKPENVLVDPSGATHLMDFGLAREVSSSDRMTVTGQVMGTPSYMAPEQADGSTTDQGPHSDVYSLGALLYRALVGRPPFEAPSMALLMAKILFKEPEPPRSVNPKTPPDLETIALRCLVKEKEARPTAKDVAEELRRFADGEPILSRPIGGVERAGRWVRRNRKLALAVALLATALPAAAAVVGVQLYREAARAREERRKALALEREVDEVLEHEGRSQAEPGADGIYADDGYRSALASLAAHPGPSTVRRLGEVLDAAGHDLAPIARDVLGRAGTPDADEAAKGEPPIAGIDAALDAFQALRPGEALDAPGMKVLAAARKRIDRRERRRATNGRGDAHSVLLRVAKEKLGPGKLRLVQLASDGLAQIHPARAPVEQLWRYLLSEEDSVRAAHAGIALAASRSRDADLALAAELDRRGRSDLFSQRLESWLVAQGGKLSWEPTTTADTIVHGFLRSVRHDADGAIDDFTRAIEREPGNAAAWRGRSQAFDRKGALEKALADSKRAVELNPEPRELSNGAIIKMKLGDFAGARADLDRVIEIDPEKAGAWSMRSKARDFQGDVQGALEDATHALELDGGSALIWYQRAFARGVAGDNDGALSDYEQGLAVDPRNVALWAARGHLEAGLGRLDEARASLSRAIELDPGQPDAWADRARVAALKGDYDAALSDLAQGLAHVGDNVELLALRGAIRTNRKDFAGARADLVRGRELAPSDPMVLRGLGRLEAETGERDAAIADLGRAAEGARDPVFLAECADGLEHAGDREGAIAILSRAIELVPSYGKAWIMRGSLRWRLGQAAEALADLKRGAELDPGSADGWQASGIVKAMNHDPEGAVADLTRAVELSPRNVQLWHDRGSVRMAMKDWDGAIADYSRAIDLLPRRGLPWMERSEARLGKGDREGAAADAKRGLELEPGVAADPRAKRLLEALERGR
jgi:tetratricopeptide (TPR) repeat protein/tRNA A-37 threonylcarbamoyl transferase component Bud32